MSLTKRTEPWLYVQLCEFFFLTCTCILHFVLVFMIFSSCALPFYYSTVMLSRLKDSLNVYCRSSLASRLQDVVECLTEPSTKFELSRNSKLSHSAMIPRFFYSCSSLSLSQAIKQWTVIYLSCHHKVGVPLFSIFSGLPLYKRQVCGPCCSLCFNHQQCGTRYGTQFLPTRFLSIIEGNCATVQFATVIC